MANAPTARLVRFAQGILLRSNRSPWYGPLGSRRRATLGRAGLLVQRRCIPQRVVILAWARDPGSGCDWRFPSQRHLPVSRPNRRVNRIVGFTLEWLRLCVQDRLAGMNTSNIRIVWTDRLIDDERLDWSAPRSNQRRCNQHRRQKALDHGLTFTKVATLRRYQRSLFMSRALAYSRRPSDARNRLLLPI
jgi:hypothetical protein